MITNLPLRYYAGRGIEELVLKSSLLGIAYYRFAPCFYEWKYRRRIPERFEAPITIFKHIEVDPKNIEYISGREFTTGPERRRNIGRVQDGDWDLNPRRHIENEGNFVYQAIHAHFINEVPWEETDLYQWAINQIEIDGNLWHGCQNETEVRQRFKRIENLYRTICNKGYKTQRELNGNSVDFVNQYLNEVCVDLGRTGEVFLVDGRHRVAIAKIAGLDKIPVFPVVRHNSWMKQRERSWENTSSQYADHPDLIEVI